MTDTLYERTPVRSRADLDRILLSALTLAAALVGSSDAQAQTVTWWPRSQEGGAIGGFEADGTPLRICRSNDVAYPGNHPGKTQPGSGTCAIPFGNTEVFTTWFETLMPGWTTGTAYGGTSFGSEGGATLGVCRSLLQGPAFGLHIGKHIRNVNACAIGFGKTEHWASSYTDLNEANFAIEAVSGRSSLAIEGGWDANLVPVHICIGTAPGIPGEHPGELYAGACHFGYGGSEVVTTTYKTLVPVYRRTTQDTSTLPIFVAGTDVNGTQLGVCKKTIPNAGLQTGKYRFQDNTCHISYAGQALVYTASQGFDTLRRR